MGYCVRCKNESYVIDPTAGLCINCLQETETEGQFVEATKAVSPSVMAGIVLTTESAPNLPIAERLDIVTAEVVIGMHLFKDIASAFSDAFGGRSKTMQKGLREARTTALDELRREAHALGADAVVAVHLAYSEISGGGKSMLFLVASGTAVKLTSR